MAISTAAGRQMALAAAARVCTVPRPDGSIGAEDRGQIMGIYYIYPANIGAKPENIYKVKTEIRTYTVN